MLNLTMKRIQSTRNKIFIYIFVKLLKIYFSLDVSQAHWLQLTTSNGTNTLHSLTSCSVFSTVFAQAIIEQASYGPFACASFFIGMSLLEFKTFTEAIEETKEKFLPTYKVGICVWPILQTINFSLVPEHNRIVFVSICSLLWTTFLAYMKKKELASKQKLQPQTVRYDHLNL